MANKGKHLIENDYTPVTYDPQYILMVNHLKKYFPIKGGLLSQTVGHVKAVDGVTFNLRRGCTMGLVGESGCGKSTTGRTILRLGGEKTGGQVLFNGKEVYDMTPAEMRELRTKMQIIFQDPFSSLSPRLPVGEIIGEAVREHNLVPKNEFNDYDNSFLILLFGVLGVVLLITAVILWMRNLRNAREVELTAKSGKHVNTFRDDLNDALDRKFHRTLLTLPVLGVVLFSRIEKTFMDTV